MQKATFAVFSGFNLGSGTNDTTGTPNYTLSSLNSSSAYDFYVQAICSSGDSSLWTGPYTINTLISGPSGINCTSGGNPGFVYSDDLESQAGWTGTFGSGTTCVSKEVVDLKQLVFLFRTLINILSPLVFTLVCGDESPVLVRSSASL